MKNHLKRVTSPNTWALPRRGRVFITKPLPSGHVRSQGLPLGILLRDVLGLASTMSEAKKLLQAKEVLVDGQRQKNPRLLVGLFDTLVMPSLKKQYRVVLDNQSCLALASISAEESSLKLGKVVGKSLLKKSQMQYHLHDGRNVISEVPSKVGDSFLISLPEQKVQKIFPLKAAMKILVHQGKNSGSLGTVKEIVNHESTYLADDKNSPKKKEVTTFTKYLFVVGEKEAALTVSASASTANIKNK